MADLLDKGCKTAVLKMLKERKTWRKKRKPRVNKIETSVRKQETLEENKKKILELKNITEMKNSLEGFKDRLEQAEERIHELEDGRIEIIKCKEQKVKRLKKSKESLKNLQDTIKWTNMYTVEVPEEQREREWTERIFEEIMTEDFPNLMKDMTINMQQGQQTPSNSKNSKSPTPRHIINKLSKDNRVLKHKHEQFFPGHLSQGKGKKIKRRSGTTLNEQS